MYNYWCKNRINTKECKYCDKKGDLQLDEKGEHICPNSKTTTLKLMGETVIGRVGSKMDSQKIKADRRKRSTEHFKKEVLPTFAPGTTEEKHFKKKHGYKS